MDFVNENFFLSRREYAPCSLNLKSMKQQLKHIKNELLPKHSNDLESMRQLFEQPEIIDKFGYTLDKQHRLYHQTVTEANFAFTIFVSYDTIDIIAKNIPPGQRHYLLDGTFKTAPRPFYQVLVLSIEFKNDVSPRILLHIRSLCHRYYVDLILSTDFSIVLRPHDKEIY